MNVVFQGLIQHKLKMRTLGAIAIRIGTFVIGFRNGHVKQALGFLNLLADARQVRNFQRRSILLDDVHKRNAIEVQLVVEHTKLILRKIKRLLDEVDVFALHVHETMRIKSLDCKVNDLDGLTYLHPSNVDAI